MDVRLQALTKKEIKTIALLEFSADLSKDAQKQKLSGMLKQKRYFSSEAGLDYEKAFFEYVKNGKGPVSCTLCHGNIDEEDLFICKGCRSAIKQMAKSGAGAAEPKKKKSLFKKKNKDADDFAEGNYEDENGEDAAPKKSSNFLLGVVIGIILCLVVAAAIYVAVYKLKNGTYKKKDISDIPNTYGELMEEYGYSLGEVTLADNGSIVYEILPQHDALIIYPDEDDKLEGASLVLSGTGNQDKVSQMMLISLLNMTIYNDTDSSAMMDMIGDLIEAGGEFTYEGYRWNLVPLGNTTYYFIVTEGSGDTSGYSVSLPKNDITQMLGEDYGTVSEILGESVAIIAENTRYYEASGVSLVYDPDTGKVIYLDADGTGSEESLYGMFGVYVGMDYKEAKEAVEALGETPGSKLDDTWVYDFEVDGEKREFAIEMGNDNKVGLVSYKIIN